MNNATEVLIRVKKSSAFNINDAKKVKVNQFLTKYIFKDASVLLIYPKSLTACTEYKTVKSELVGILGNPNPKYNN